MRWAAGFAAGVPYKTASTGLWPNTFEEVKVGAGYDLARLWNGQIDETRMSIAARSADWIATEYNNQNSPSTFYTIYPENTMNVAVDPATAALYGSQTQQFSSLVFGGCTAVNWTVTPATAGTVNTSGLYTAPASIAAAQTVSVKATSVNDSSKFGTATVTLYPAISVTITLAGVTMYQGQSQQLNALVSNAVNTAVTWTLSPQVGTLSASGLYTAPSSITATQTVVVTATSQVDGTKAGSIVVTLSPGQGVQTSQGIFGLGLDLVAQALCRRPHVAPVADAGPDQFTNLSSSGTASVALEGVATNFFLNPGKSLAYTWSKTSGPGTVTFSNANAGVTQATFSAAGNYELQFSVNDGVATSTDSMFVTVSPAIVDNGYSFLITPVVSGPNAVGSQVTLTLRLQGVVRQWRSD